MNDEINYKNNPLHGVSLKNMLIELVDHYGFEILFAYLNINCFSTKPSIDSSVKFLKKTDWAREKVEAFYLYQFKSLPRASAEQFKLPPRDRIIPEDHVPGEPAELSLEDAERLREKREQKAAGWDQRSSSSRGSDSKYGSNNKYGSNDKYGANNKHGSSRPSRSSRDDSYSTRKAPPASSGNSNPWANWENRNKSKD